MYIKIFKRFLDIVISLIGLIVLSPLFILLILLVAFTSKGPVFFVQKRLGKNGQEFNMLKFRSMVVGAEAGGVYSNDKDIRVTKIGKLLRKTSLDELPQLINMLKGEMSLIGPRPPLTYHPWPLAEYTDEQKRMFEVRPGLTGWAQVHGRKEVEWNQRIKLNIWYVDHVSLKLDIKIFFMTIFKVLISEGNENISATVERPSEEIIWH